MKKTMTRKIAVVAVLIIAFVILSIVMPGQHNLKCGDCDGTGMVDAAVCELCAGSGVGTEPADSNTPIPRLDASIMEDTRSSIALVNSTELSPVSPAWIEPVTVIEPTQNSKVADTKPSATDDFSPPDFNLCRWHHSRIGSRKRSTKSWETTS